jgi:hypothetical protein
MLSESEDISLKMQIMLTNVKLLILNVLTKGLLNLNSAQKQFHAVSKSPAC